ncbi:MAG: lysophospholipid acyltransferase family protein [Syntrophothermus sp.]
MSYFKILLIGLYAVFSSILALLSAIFDRSFTSYFWVSKIFSKGIFFIGGIKVNITGLENFDHKKTYIFVSNHTSQFDIMTVQAAIPVKLSMFFKKELAKIPIFGWQLSLGPYIRIDRQRAGKAAGSIEKAKYLIGKGISVLLFAEGTRSLTGEIQPFKRGAFNLAAQIGVPIVPITLSGTSKILPKGSINIQNGTIGIHFDKPISTESVKSRQDEINIMNEVRNIIVNNYEKARYDN